MGGGEESGWGGTGEVNYDIRILSELVLIKVDCFKSCYISWSTIDLLEARLL